ncbi:MAG: sulfatase-like hydrolase/transferase, partial [Xanthomonadales bacterium]|nr:sulfatase-like hydrolase/transferase [Xanthomonadales bacterium]
MTRPVVTVLVVGETARADHFSLGGYERRTNPRLAAKDIVYFSDVSSCGTATRVSLPCMFSDLGRQAYSKGEAKRREGLLDVLNHAGIKTVWLDNNAGCKGVC